MNGMLKAVVSAGFLAAPLMVLAQVPAPVPPAAPAFGTHGPVVGDVAPDFTLPGATRYGLLKAPVHLADYRGQTVVLAFFVQARTKG
jgi:hypothetical protein